MDNSITIKGLYDSGKISFYISKEALKGSVGRKQLIKIHSDDFKEWGHVVKITPSDITLQLRETKALNRDEVDVTLWPDKPLDSIVVENEPPCLARNDGFITNI